MAKDVVKIEVKQDDTNFERLVERLSRIKPRFYFLSKNVWSPNIDVYRIGTDVLIKVELPGVSKDAVSIKLNDRLLSIEGARWDPDSESRQNFFLMEIEYGRFFREIELPYDVDGERADAVYQDGFLIIKFPLKEKEVREIEL